MKAFESAALLSSGTIAGLIGKGNYDAIERFRNDFLDFIENSETEFQNWIDAFNAFKTNNLNFTENE
jgi:hypothetical protein